GRKRTGAEIAAATLLGSPGVMTEDVSLPAEAAGALDSWLGRGWTASQLTGDASVRIYYRVTAPDEKRYVLAYYPDEVRHDVVRVLRREADERAARSDDRSAAAAEKAGR